jgi:Transposase IS116/IS110/IS902 family
MVPSERSSGGRERRGAITKAGNARLRRVLIEAAHHHRHQPRLSVRQRARARDADPSAQEIAWKAQNRRIACTAGPRGCWPRPSPRARSSAPSRASSSASSGPSPARPRSRARRLPNRQERRSARPPERRTDTSPRVQRDGGVRGRGGHGRRTLDSVMWFRPTSPVRGSSRRIMSMRRASLDPRISA